MKYAIIIEPAENGFTITYDGGKRKVLEEYGQSAADCAQRVLNFVQQYMLKEEKS